MATYELFNQWHMCYTAYANQFNLVELNATYRYCFIGDRTFILSWRMFQHIHLAYEYNCTHI